VNKACKQKI